MPILTVWLSYFQIVGGAAGLMTTVCVFIYWLLFLQKLMVHGRLPAASIVNPFHHQTGAKRSEQRRFVLVQSRLGFTLIKQWKTFIVKGLSLAAGNKKDWFPYFDNNSCSFGKKKI